MIKQVVLGAALLVAMATVPAVSTFAKNDKVENEKYKITICHRNNSDENADKPYVEITIDVDAVTGEFLDHGNGDHHKHTGPVVTSVEEQEAFKAAHTKWGDIIPAGAHNDSLNLENGGQAVLDNHCNFVTPTTPETPPVTPVTPVEPGRGNITPPTPTPVTVTETTQPAAEVLPYTAGDHTFAIALIAAGLATIVAGLGIGINALYRRSA